MKSVVVAVALFATMGTAQAFQPHTGHWIDPNQPGTGYNLDIQNGVLVMTAYSFDANGQAQWYLSAGPMLNSQRNYVGTLDKYVNGQCPTCSYRPAQIAGNDGTVSLSFANETTATITLGGRSAVIHPFDFGYGDPPTGLLGEWVFVYDIGSVTFADRFDYTVLLSGTSDGTGFAADPKRVAACEFQVRGLEAGKVLCVDGTSTGALQNAYLFNYGGIDETFNGLWISPTSGNQYAMKGFRVVSPKGFSKAAMKQHDDATVTLKASQDTGDGVVGKASPELLEKLQDLAAKLRQRQ